MAETFSYKIKSEIVSNEYALEPLKALLSAFTRINGHYTIRNHQELVQFNTNNAQIARFIFENVKKLYGDIIDIEYIQEARLGRITSYLLTIKEDANKILDDLGIDFLESKISRAIVNDDETIASYLAGVFLASGSANAPSSSDYHLELVSENKDYAKEIVRLFSRYKSFDFVPKITKRREKYVVYIKSSEKISDFLIMIKAINCCMEYESVRVDRDFINSTNRLTNLDIANMEKTVAKAKKEIKMIKAIDKTIGLKTITNKNLRKFCEIRLAHESYSYNDMAKAMSIALKVEISKSSVVRLSKKLEETYLRVCK